MLSTHVPLGAHTIPTSSCYQTARGQLARIDEECGVEIHLSMLQKFPFGENRGKGGVGCHPAVGRMALDAERSFRLDGCVISGDTF